MSTKKDGNSLAHILGSLGWPFLLGTAITASFYGLVFRGPLDMPAMHRYFAGHPVAFFATGMFFVGIVALMLKLWDVLGQFSAIGGIHLDEAPRAGQKLADVDRLLDDLQELPAQARNSYLGRRLYDALLSVRRKGSADDLDDELKYLSDMDAVRQQDSYALVRIITWATPMLGFLGTVIGITQALGDLDPQQLANDIQSAMDGLLSGLYVAFDTTALALTLSIVLMFIQFLIDRIENQLLATVDLRSNEQLVGRFERLGGKGDPHLASIQRMSESVVQSTENLVNRQSELWQSTIDAAHQRWSHLVESAGEHTQDSLTAALDHSLSKHATKMAEIEYDAAQRAHERWEQLQTSISANARMMQAQQEEMIKQGEVLLQVVKATGEVVRLEQSLNQNLEALAGAKNFEDTVMSLSAAIHLLNTRLVGGGAAAKHVELTDSESKGRAA